MRIAALGVLALSLMPAFAATDAVSDAVLVARATAVMSVKQAPADRMLGVHKGAPVIVDVRCATDCPRLTVRIIRYIIEPGAVCIRLGGDTATITVPVSLQERPQTFCIPHALYQRKLHVDHPYQK